jgi:hypothetical protein
MSVKSIVGVVTGFLAHYATEAGAAATALDMIVDALPIQPQDKATIKGHIATIAAAPGAITTALENLNLETPTPVKIDAADIERAVAGWMASNGVTDIKADIKSEVAAYFEANPVRPVLDAPAPNDTGTGE